MEKSLLIKKIETLKGFREWMPGQRESFEWTSSCNCWIPMIPKYLNAFKQGLFDIGIGSCILSTHPAPKQTMTEQFLDACKNHPESIKAIDECGILYEELANFEFLIRFWEGDNFETKETIDYLNFDNGLIYISEWIEHLEKELAAMSEPDRIDVTYTDLVDHIPPDEVADLIMESVRLNTIQIN